jgi:hypothetical protein
MPPVYRSFVGLAIAAALMGSVVLGDARLGVPKLIWGFGFAVLFGIAAWRLRTAPLARPERVAVITAATGWALLWLPFHAVVGCSCLPSGSTLMPACSALGALIRATPESGMVLTLSWIFGPYCAMALALVLGGRGLWVRWRQPDLLVTA